jgi:uncharacterized membrane protein/membrane-bound inhibitor of C-type lysozyme
MGAVLGLALAACGDSSGPPPSEPPETAAPEEQVAPHPPERDLDVNVYACDDGTSYTVAIGPEAALLLLPDGARRLPHVRSASGARYASDDGTEFWNKGEEAMLLIDGVQLAGCRSDAMAAVWETARVRGVDYRAVGNEPGWHLEIVDGGVSRFVGDYGELVIEFDTPPAVDGGGPGSVDYFWQDGERRIEVRLRPEDCRDTMVDVTYPLRARVKVDDRVFDGCARALGDDGA